MPDPRPVHSISWRVHAAAERPGAALAAALVILAASGAAYLFMGHPVWSPVAAALALIVLTLSLQRFFFPGRFEVDDRGVTARWLVTSQFIGWGQARRFAHDDRSGLLSRRARPSRLDAYARAGVHLLLPRDPQARAEVVAMIERKLQSPALAPGSAHAPASVPVPGRVPVPGGGLDAQPVVSARGAGA
jgi:hypothetical protein